MIHKISHKKLNSISILSILSSIIMYFGFMLIEIFSYELSSNEYALLILMSIILTIGIIGLLSGIISFFKIKKLKLNNKTISKSDIILTIATIIINFGIVVYSFLNLVIVIYFIAA